MFSAQYLLLEREILNFFSNQALGNINYNQFLRVQPLLAKQFWALKFLNLQISRRERIYGYIETEATSFGDAAYVE